MSPSLEPTPPPALGIFWQVPGDQAGTTVLVTDATPLAQAEAYGAMLTHPRGHCDVWEAWQRLGPTGLARRGLPMVIAWSEYDEHPRGRIVHDPAADLLTIYADRRLQRPRTVAAIIAAFGLCGQRVVVRSDSHYRS